MKANHLYTWFVSISGGILTFIIQSDIIKLLLSLWRKDWDRDREKKNAIKGRYKAVYLEGMGNEFGKPPQDFRSLIYDAEIWDYRELSNKLSNLRFAWTYASLINNPDLAQEAGINPKYEGFSEQNRRSAVKLANEIKDTLGHL